MTSAAIYHSVFQYTTALGRVPVDFILLGVDEIHLPSSPRVCGVCSHRHGSARPAVEELEG